MELCTTQLLFARGRENICFIVERDFISPERKSSENRDDCELNILK